MALLLQFSGVAHEGIAGLSFSLEAGDLRVLKAGSKEKKTAVIELAVGERSPDVGSITLRGEALAAAPPGSFGWVPANGGLISNLKTWENVTLPLWYHGRRHAPASTEERIKSWLTALGMESREWEDFMASPSGRLGMVERKAAGLLRGLVLSPSLLVLDAALFDGLEHATRDAWAAALDRWAAESSGAVLAVADREAALPWRVIE